jgi:hypothetical protein
LKESSIDINFRNMPQPRLLHKNSDAFSFGAGCRPNSRRKLTDISDLDEVLQEDIIVEQEPYLEEYNECEEISIFQDPRTEGMNCQSQILTQFGGGTAWNFGEK